MAELEEILVGELRLERLDEPLRRLARGVGDHVQLDRGHRRSLVGPTGPYTGPEAAHRTIGACASSPGPCW